MVFWTHSQPLSLRPTSGYLPTMGPSSLARVAEGLLLRRLVSDTTSSRGPCGAREGRKGMATLITGFPEEMGQLRPGRGLLPSAQEGGSAGVGVGGPGGGKGFISHIMKAERVKEAKQCLGAQRRICPPHGPEASPREGKGLHLQKHPRKRPEVERGCCERELSSSVYE